MFQRLLMVLFSGLSLSAWASNNTSGPIAQNPAQAHPTTTVKAGNHDNSVTSSNATVNNPTVNSLLYSGSQFPEQNKLSGKKDRKYYSSQEMKKKTNNPNVSSFAYSGSQFPQQNQLTGTKNKKYYTSQERKQHKNNPMVNSRLYSGAQFPQHDNLNQSGN